MLKKLIFAIAPLALMVAIVRADDGDLNFDLASISDAQIEIDDAGLDNLDVDQLGAQAEGESTEDAIEACFRRFGYRYGGYGYGGYGYGGYSNWYRPCYSYGYNYCSYPSFYCYRPIYHYAVAPIYNYYWGCH